MIKVLGVQQGQDGVWFGFLSLILSPPSGESSDVIGSFCPVCDFFTTADLFKGNVEIQS